MVSAPGTMTRANCERALTFSQITPAGGNEGNPRLPVGIHAAGFATLEDARLVQATAKITLEVSLELQNEGRFPPHPSDHYPFMTAGEYAWLRYPDLDAEQRAQLKHASVRSRRA